jgi:hypothetical protein
MTMDQVELLTVENAFEISGRGAVLIPDFSVPERWKDRVDSVILATPDGRKIATEARFNLSHFSLSDPKAPVDKFWRVVVLLPDCRKEQVPVGSKLLVPSGVRRAILP